jgi:hypothetical protein
VSALGLEGLLLTADRLMWVGASSEAIAVLERARAMAGSPVEQYSVGVSLLRASNGRLGWDLYDLHPSRPADRLPGMARWDGRPCQVLVLVAEQGFGDAIQFLRYAHHAVDHAESVVLAVHDELLEIISTSPQLRMFQVMSKSKARHTAWPKHARWERLMSIPAKLGPLPIEPVEPYLSRDVGPRPPHTPGEAVTVGIVWRSTPRRGVPSRSIPTRALRYLAGQEHLRLVALHRDRDIRTRPKGVEVVGIRDFADTVRAMSECDYVVSVDTVTAHLAPAIGVPTLVCLRHRPDWRWGTPANPTLWYRAAELMFQDGSQRWEPVLAEAGRRIADRPPRPALQHHPEGRHEHAER